METKGVILASFCFIACRRNYPNNTKSHKCYPFFVIRFSKKNLFLMKNSEKSILAIIRLNYTFSTIFLINNGHRAISEKCMLIRSNIAELVTIDVKCSVSEAPAPT